MQSLKIEACLTFSSEDGGCLLQYIKIYLHFFMLKIKGSFQKKRKKSSHDDLFLSTQKDTCGGVQGFLREPTKKIFQIRAKELLTGH